ncbi:MAG: hypothetical protein M3Q06_07490 [Bacteroidota bacterium]|nr:hypothetical protein [Bacteroidota bacterium]
MEADKNQQSNETGQQQKGDDIRGRIHNSQNPEFEQESAQNDISGIDQQEGNMHHGEQGANLAEGKEEA